MLENTHVLILGDTLFFLVYVFTLLLFTKEYICLKWGVINFWFTVRRIAQSYELTLVSLPGEHTCTGINALIPCDGWCTGMTNTPPQIIRLSHVTIQDTSNTYRPLFLTMWAAEVTYGSVASNWATRGYERANMCEDHPAIQPLNYISICLSGYDKSMNTIPLSSRYLISIYLLVRIGKNYEDHPTI